MKYKGNDLVRCHLCRVVVQAGEPEGQHFQREHSRWELVLWWWDNGHRLPLLIVLAEIEFLVTCLVIVLRRWWGL